MNDVIELVRLKKEDAGSCQVGKDHPHRWVQRIRIGVRDEQWGHTNEIRLCERHLAHLILLSSRAMREGSATLERL